MHIRRGGIAPLINFNDHSTGAFYTYATLIRRMGTVPAKDVISEVYGLTPTKNTKRSKIMNQTRHSIVCP